MHAGRGRSGALWALLVAIACVAFAPLASGAQGTITYEREDECIEVTPSSVRVRKVVLPKVQRLKTARLARK